MIIGIKENDRVVLGYSNEYLEQDLTTGVENTGVWKVKRNPHTLVGVDYTNVRTDALRYEHNIFSGEMNYKQINVDVRKKINELYASAPYLANTKLRYPDLVIAQNNNLFYTYIGGIFVSNDYVVLAEEDEVAKGVLEATKELPAEERILKAFKYVNDSACVRGFPVYIMDTKTCKQKIIREYKELTI